MRIVRSALERCRHLCIYAMGKGREPGIADCGFVEDEASGQIVWQMHHFETGSAGHP